MKKWTLEEITYLKGNFQTKGIEIAEQLGRSHKSVSRKAEQLGLSCALRLQARSVNPYFFDSWSSSSAYILGNAFADATIEEGPPHYRIRFQVKVIDEPLIHFVKEQLSSKHTIVYHPQKAVRLRSGKITTIRPQVSLSIPGKLLVSKLVGLGLRQAKSKRNDPFPAYLIPFPSDFCRGYIDGDGHWTKRGRLIILGSLRFLKGLRSLIVTGAGVPIPKVRPRKGGRLFWIGWSSKNNLTKIVTWLYENASFCLARKEQRAKQLV